MLRGGGCKSPGCNNPIWSKGLCKHHMPKKRLRSHKTPEQINKDKIEADKMRALFQEIWDSLPKVKKCWACNKRIYGEILSIYFDHLLEKETYPQFKYDPRNIFFCCGDCHTSKGNGFPMPLHEEAINKAKKELLNDGLE